MIEVGKEYITRDGLYVARIISTVGQFDRARPIVAELYENLEGKKAPAIGFHTYEHFTRTGRYLGVNDSSLDLLVCENQLKLF